MKTHGERVIDAIKKGMQAIDEPCDKCGGITLAKKEDNGPHGWLVYCLDENCARARGSCYRPIDHDFDPHVLKPNKRLRRWVEGTRCEICRREELELPEKWGMHVHHVIPQRIGGPDTPQNLRIYCKACHELVHAIRRRHERDEV